MLKHCISHHLYVCFKNSWYLWETQCFAVGGSTKYSVFPEQNSKVLQISFISVLFLFSNFSLSHRVIKNIISILGKGLEPELYLD